MLAYQCRLVVFNNCERVLYSVGVKRSYNIISHKIQFDLYNLV